MRPGISAKPMKNNRPNVDPDGFYNQKEAAAALGVDRHTVRTYELNGDLTFFVRKASKRKVTTGAAIIKCWETVF